MVARVDSAGDMYLKGTVSEDVDPLQPPDDSVIFKNDDEDVVAFIDEDGNLELAGCAVIWEGGP